MSTTVPPFVAPSRRTPVDADVVVPGSKSLTNRALVLASLADGPSTLSEPLVSRDTDLMAAALTSLGAHVRIDDGACTVAPGTRPRGDAPVLIDCGLAGTVMRFVPPLAALTEARIGFDGDPRARERPMATTIASLRALGVEVTDDGRDALPFTVHGVGEVRGGDLVVDASASSQFVSALLLAAPAFREGLDLRHVGGPLPSLPHIDMTVEQLAVRGVRVTTSPGRWTVEPGPVSALDQTIEPDLSNAGVFVGAALVTGGAIRVRHWPQRTDQAGDAWGGIVQAFGGSVERDGDALRFIGPATLEAVRLDLHDVGELTPVIAAVAACGPGRSVLTGIAHLRGHETDRLAALARELGALGAEVEELPDGLAITGRPLRASTFRTYHDHRMVHAAAVLGLVVEGLRIDDVDTAAKTWPGFAGVWSRWVTAGDG